MYKVRLMRAATACVILVLALVLSGCAQQTKLAPERNTGLAKPEATSTETQIDGVNRGGDLVIPVADITETVTFYPVEVDGTEMEVIAVRASDGTIRTAFNTCQICYSSGRGYYKQVKDMLVCQNCGNRFPMDRVEVEAGGCNPWPIFAKDKAVESETITISSDFLSASKEIFENWKQSF